MPFLSSLAESGASKLNIKDLAAPETKKVPTLRSFISLQDWEAMMNYQLSPVSGPSHTVLSSADLVAQATGYPFDRTKVPSFETFERDQKLWFEEITNDGNASNLSGLMLASQFASHRQLHGTQVESLDKKIIDYYWGRITDEIESSKRRKNEKHSPRTVQLVAWFNVAFPQIGGVIRYPFSDGDKARIKVFMRTDDLIQSLTWKASYKLLYPQEMPFPENLVEAVTARLNEYAMINDWIPYAVTAGRLAILLAQDVKLTPNGISLKFENVYQPEKSDTPPPARSF